MEGLPKASAKSETFPVVPHNEPAVPDSQEAAVSAPESFEVGPERLEKLRQKVEFQFKMASGLSGFSNAVAYGRVQVEGITDPERRAEAEAEQKFREDIFEKATAARERLMQNLRMSATALFLAFGAPHAMETPTPEHGYETRTAAAKQLEEDGITKYQRSAHINGLSEALARGLFPFSYGMVGTSQKVFGADAVRGLTSAIMGTASNFNNQTEESLARKAEAEGATREEAARALRIFRNRMDAWRLYLGLPQENNTFGISEYRPAKSKDDTYYYAIREARAVFSAPSAKEAGVTNLQATIEYIRRQEGGGTKPLAVNDKVFGIMGNYTLSLGQDERGSYLSYWDRWDLDGSLEGKDGVIGKPYEIYDRIYYDPATFALLD